jgi:class 3 adenylate cyclase
MSTRAPLHLPQERRTEVSLLVAFADLTRYSAESLRIPTAELAEAMNGFYERVEAFVTRGGGAVVKVMGDAALVVFPEDAVDAGVLTLLELKDDVDRYFERLGWASRLVVKVDFGPVVAGPFGAPGKARFDVLGKTVNRAAMLEASGVGLTVAAFRKLGPELRARFKKHTPPVTYIRVADPHRRR